MPFLTDHIKHLIEDANELKLLEVEIAENEICPALKKKRMMILQDVLDRARPALEMTARELRQYRTKCEDCTRCSESVDNL